MTEIIGLDVGDVRIGIARINIKAGIAEPLCTVVNDRKFYDVLKKFIKDNQSESIVVGLPRSMDGQESPQTAKTREFVEALTVHINLPVTFQDETLSSELAKQHIILASPNKAKAGLDAFAAAIILEDYVRGMNHV